MAVGLHRGDAPVVFLARLGHRLCAQAVVGRDLGNLVLDAGERQVEGAVAQRLLGRRQAIEAEKADQGPEAR
jgi:hypothetical protein